ncbi:uncharacterized protein LOC108682638 [Hyalella azteca]|uniref:Uncharacterized protein LOC108682638 n=1 Tax=Hyalella azteca TaxID=294128 RepID=A0A8B7PPG5_HYAAZ|nr:uncharacterized protein LOC108682638 [Hyalella azteca]
MGQPAHLRGHDIHFQPWGLGTVKGATEKLPAFTYREILKKIGEEESVIDYLKMDIEGAELEFFNDVLTDDVELLANVKQIGMEIHPAESTTYRDEIWRQVERLRYFNFSQVFSQLNSVKSNLRQFENKTVSCCYEILWVNEKFRKKNV